MFAFILLAICAIGIEAAKLPNTFGRCHVKSDPNLGECLRKNIENAIHLLDKGSPQIGIRPFEPLEIPALVIGKGSGPVKVDQNFFDIKLYGLTGSKVISSTVDLDKKTMFSKSITPELRLQARYEMAGKILVFPISGNGPCNVTLYNTRINHTLQAETFEKNGKTHWKFSDYKVTLRPERVTFKFDNLFNGQEPLGSEINKVLNENWEDVFTDVRQGYEKSFGLIFHDLANRVFTRVALKDIFYLD